jgi:hypothetical protein
MNQLTSNKYEIDGYKESKISYSIIKQKNVSNKLAIILPGMGYNVHKPLLHFATNLFINNEYDVLHVNYNYISNEVYKELSQEEKVECIQLDVKRVIDAVLDGKTYSGFVLIAKSIGTIPISNELLTRVDFKDAKAIWLTPLLHNEPLFERMKHLSNHSLFVIGDSDPCYVKERFDELAKEDHNTSVLIKGADHSLEEKDIQASLDNLKLVLQEMERFIA